MLVASQLKLSKQVPVLILNPKLISLFARWCHLLQTRFSPFGTLVKTRQALRQERGQLVLTTLDLEEIFTRQMFNSTILTTSPPLIYMSQVIVQAPRSLLELARIILLGTRRMLKF